MVKNEKEKKKEEVVEPIVDGFRINAKRVAPLEKILASLSSLTFVETLLEADQVIGIYVESRDIKKNPYVFSVLYLKPNSIEVVYTIVPEISPRKRRVNILKYFMDVLTLIDFGYEFDRRELYQIVSNTLRDISEFASSDYEKIYAEYDALKNEFALQEKKMSRLTSANEKLGLDNLELKSKNDELILKINELEKYPDDVLMLKVQEWLFAHNFELNVAEFCNVHKVKETRVEQILHKMVAEGILQPR